MVMDEESGLVAPVRDGDHFTCPNCGCEIRVRHQGDEDRIERMVPFTCYCGTLMRKQSH